MVGQSKYERWWVKTLFEVAQVSERYDNVSVLLEKNINARRDLDDLIRTMRSNIVSWGLDTTCIKWSSSRNRIPCASVNGQLSGKLWVIKWLVRCVNRLQQHSVLDKYRETANAVSHRCRLGLRMRCCYHSTTCTTGVAILYSDIHTVVAIVQIVYSWLPRYCHWNTWLLI